MIQKKNKKITIKKQSEIEIYFKDKSIKLLKNSSLTFINKIKIEPNVTFKGNNFFGEGNIIESNCRLENVKIGNRNKIRYSSQLLKSTLGKTNIIGPFAYIRDNTSIKNDCIVGAYVETTRSIINSECKISHQAFIGDAKIGKNTIIGAGTIFCNFNFKTLKKEKTIIGSFCKIGSNVTIISPKKIKSKTLIPASSIVKKNKSNH